MAVKLLKQIRLTSHVVLLCGLVALGAIGSSCTFNTLSRQVNLHPNVKVQFVDRKTGWIVGPRLLRTDDSGQTWNVIRDDGEGTINAGYIFGARKGIQFTDRNVGWMLDTGGIIKTTDGGLTWSDSYSVPIREGAPLGPLFFISPEEGWVIGEHIYHTSDGGRSWQQLSEAPRGHTAKWSEMNISSDYAYSPAIYFSNANHGLIAHMNGEIYLTNDGGKTWEMVWQADKHVSDVFFANNQDGWMVGLEGFAARTTDGGRTWIVTQTPTKDHFHNVFFINKQIGWAVGGSGTIIYTEDGGVTWQKSSLKDISSPPPLASVSFTDELNGWAVGGNGTEGFSSNPSNIVLTTVDGGRTWRSIQP